MEEHKMSRLPRVIINADDLGMNGVVNREIARCLEHGWITSSSILANGPSFHEGIAIARGFPDRSFGIHMNLTEFLPLSGERCLSRFCDASGALNGRFRSLVRVTDSSCVLREWSAQVQRVVDSGLPISHLDSHHHSHTVPVVIPALKGVQRTHGIQRVRTTRNIIPTAMEGGLSRITKLACKRVWHRALVSLAPAAQTTDLFGSVTDFVLRAKEVSPSSWEGKTIELMCHPGRSENYSFQREYEWLRAGLEDVVGFNLEFITFYNI